MSAVAPQMLWSAQQQIWLSALGHTLYLQGALPEMPIEAVASVGRQTPVASAPASRAAAPTTSASTAVRQPAAPHRSGSRLPDRLHFALIRASGCNPNAPGAAELFASWPPSSELRGNPAAKRALWPRLRALRKSAQT